MGDVTSFAYHGEALVVVYSVSILGREPPSFIIFPAFWAFWAFTSGLIHHCCTIFTNGLPQIQSEAYFAVNADMARTFIPTVSC
jgi:hypothetical protein